MRGQELLRRALGEINAPMLKTCEPRERQARLRSAFAGEKNAGRRRDERDSLCALPCAYRLADEGAPANRAVGIA